jgi:hypothetical protein
MLMQYPPLEKKTFGGEYRTKILFAGSTIFYAGVHSLRKFMTPDLAEAIKC